jgi:hypothetical protein
MVSSTKHVKEVVLILHKLSQYGEKEVWIPCSHFMKFKDSKGTI